MNEIEFLVDDFVSVLPKIFSKSIWENGVYMYSSKLNIIDISSKNICLFEKLASRKFKQLYPMDDGYILYDHLGYVCWAK